MIRQILTVTLLFVLLAGCTAEKPSVATQSTTQAFTAQGTVPVAQKMNLTDTVHLGAVPHVTGIALTGTEPIRIAVPSDYASSTDVAAWTIPRPLTFQVAANLSIWVDVEGTVTNAGTATGAGCFWYVLLRLDDGSAQGKNLAGACANEDPVVPTGLRQLDIKMPSVNTSGMSGKTLSLHLVTYGAYSPGATVEVLTGSGSYDSSVTIAGLQAPLATSTAA